MASLKSTIVKEVFAEESQHSNYDDDIQFVRGKRDPLEPGGDSSGALFEIVPKVENIDIVIESSSEEEDDSNDEDWEANRYDVPNTRKRKTAPEPKTHGKIPALQLSPSRAECKTGSGNDNKLSETESEPTSPEEHSDSNDDDGNDRNSNLSNYNKKKYKTAPGSKISRQRPTQKLGQIKEICGAKMKTIKRWKGKIEECEICGVKVKTLKMHMATHMHPHKCPDCPKTFSRKLYLTGHRRIHTGEKPFKCDFCPIAFLHKAPLKKHVLEKHVVVQEFPCKQCKKAFINQKQLNEHIKSSHP